MKITDIDCHVLVADDFDPGFTSSAQDSLLVVVRTDDGVEGYGESDVNPWIGRACIEAPGTHTMGLGIVGAAYRKGSGRHRGTLEPGV